MLWRTVWRFLKKLKIELPMIQQFHSWAYIQKRQKLIQKDPCTPMFIAVLFTIAKTFKQLKFPSRDEWIKKMWYIYTMEYYSAKKRMK